MFAFPPRTSELSTHIQHVQFDVSQTIQTQHIQNGTCYHLPTDALLSKCSFTLCNWYHYKLSSLKQNSKVKLFSLIHPHIQFITKLFCFDFHFFLPALLRYNRYITLSLVVFLSFILPILSHHHLFLYSSTL